MPHLFPFASHGNSEDGLQEMGDDTPAIKPRRSSLLKNLGGLWRRNHDQRDLAAAGVRPPSALSEEHPETEGCFESRRSSLPDSVSCVPRRVVPSLPRPQTFRRQESEKREKLLEVPPSPSERRTLSLDRRRGLSASAARRPLSPKPVPLPSVSAPDIVASDRDPSFISGITESNEQPSKPPRDLPELTPLQIPDQPNNEVDIENDDEEAYQSSLQEEYDRRWILNLSMHFRDKSNREKFFVTHAETPTRWRRLTISLDYRNAVEGSLEADLCTLHYQRDKSLRIYEAIRESLPEIQYYKTVTNLKLETTPDDGQLHVHVREDANEIIHYPSNDLFRHVKAPRFKESEVEFISHLSGFVYKVRTEDRTLIKKEIPGPDTVDEFLYEVNALDSLLGCRHVIQLEGLVTDNSGSIVKGLLIAYASEGALVDRLFDERNSIEWHRREKWARQIVEGLSDIHEAGFVQGDFTLSNIVINSNDDAIIIDINRRGCPVGWEPPELGKLIDSGQRIGMCIGVKTDLYQLGMVLWSLAEGEDNPEHEEKPLRPVIEGTPYYYRKMVESCLSEHPQGRSSAKRLLRKFPLSAGRPPSNSQRRSSAGLEASQRRPSMTVDFTDDVKLSDHSVSTHRSDKEYIDPEMAITLEDVSSSQRRRQDRERNRELSPFTSEQVTYFDPQEDPGSNPASTSYRFESSGSWIVGHRGRSPVSSRRRQSSPYARSASSSSATSLSGRSPPSRSRRRCGSESSENERADDSPPAEVVCEPDSESGAPMVKVSTNEEEPVKMPEPLRNKNLAGVLNEDFALLHQDSGFDETMVEQTDLAPGVGASGMERYVPSADASKVDVLGDGMAEREEQKEAVGGVETPGSFHTTPLATPGGLLQKQLGDEPKFDHQPQPEPEPEVQTEDFEPDSQQEAKDSDPPLEHLQVNQPSNTETFETEAPSKHSEPKPASPITVPADAETVEPTSQALQSAPTKSIDAPAPPQHQPDFEPQNSTSAVANPESEPLTQGEYYETRQT